jgi:aspartate aminotransferase-like enzyme
LLQKIFETSSDVLILTASGTGALEASMVSLHKRDDRVLVVDGGKFGERFHKITKAFGLETDIIKVDWGKSVSLSDIEAALSKKKYASVCVQACETSTGTNHPVAEISALLQQSRSETLLIVDGITAVGAMPIPMDALKIDVLISGSQKAFMCPPGLSFVGLSSRAIDRLSASDTSKFYFDLSKELKSQRVGQSAYTPSTALIEGLIAAMEILTDEGLKNVHERHQRLAQASRLALQALGFRLASENPAVACTAVFFPEGVDGKIFLKNIRERYGFTIAGGQDHWEGKVLRLSHLGYYTPFDHSR